ncbi:alpha/beta fold hydrolase [Cohnella faecalis]|uniref:Alpha/beta fold hydrolase n=1 Tax=Cohnella faecalis TaxID=2315694 RepID=A0A398CS21_9BACL|nr:alpha/beta fold hydrolase [Cohnella faecalis]RIE03538.1 alpha/beta fold hydrolase [Cohnella faecalis]
MNKREIRLYMLAGVATASHFLDGFRLTIHRLIEESGLDVRSKLLFPYGDWGRSLVPQLREVGRDIRGREGRYFRSIGANRALAAIDADRIDSEASVHVTNILVGHSAGGIAAVQAAQLLLERDGGTPCPVAMIGSPKCRIPAGLRESVLYVYASPPVMDGRAYVKPTDPVCRIGSFGGWTTDGRRLPAWRMDRHAPASFRGVSIAGGHPDYFRDRPPYLNEMGMTNLEITTDAVWPWLLERIESAN